MKKALLKDSLKQIKKTNKRFISILLMAFLGVGFFAGVRATSPDMKLTVDNYFDNMNVYDIKVVSTLGLTDEDKNAISKIEGVKSVYGLYEEDVFLKIKDEENVVKLLEYNNEINTPDLIEGKLPESKNECAIEYYMKEYDNIKIGDELELREDLEDDEEGNFKNTKLKVVGIVKSPVYISRDRGTTSLGTGKIDYYIYVNKNNIISDIYTEIDVIANGAFGINTISKEYDSLIKKTEDNIEQIKDERQKARYNELVDEANKKLADSETELNDKKADGEKQISDAEKEIKDAKKKIFDGEKKIKDSEKELQEGKDKAQVEFANADAEISSNETKLAEARIALTDVENLFKAKKQEAEIGINQINAGIAEIDSNLTSLNDSKSLAENVLSSLNKINTTIDSLTQTLNEYTVQFNSEPNNQELSNMIDYINGQIQTLNVQKNELLSYGITEEKLNQINAGISECNSKKQELQNQLNSINQGLIEGQRQIDEGNNNLYFANESLAVGKAELANKKNETAQKFVDAENEIQKGKKDLAKAKSDLEDGEKKLEEKKQEFNEKIAEAEGKLIDAREKINDIENAKWYILSRKDNAGFNGISQDTDNVERLGQAFPIVFFIIATLISLTTMSRMVEEERTEIGVLKALGYNNFQIMMKYLIYSFLASTIGGILGASFGLKFFPYIIISMYKMMYDINELVITFNFYYTVLGIGIMTFCIVGASIYTASKELKSTPNELMRPKAPKPGKRVLLEKIPFIWNKLNFTQKVTIRNMFRYKKKFLMTVIGIMGCTALIITGFGLKDSISKIMDYQYVDIYDYDVLIGIKNSLTDEEIKLLKIDIQNKKEIDSLTEVYLSSCEAENGENTEDTQILVVENSDVLDNVINLKDLKTGEKLVLNDNEIIITDKLSQLLNVKVGDDIILRDSDDNEYTAKIGGISEHYIAHYVYMTNSLYEQLFKKEYSSNIIFAKYQSKLDEAQEEILSKELLQDSKISSVTLTSYLMKTMDDTLDAMNYVVYVLIISAGLLAFIVLYNLANVNISERIRELATIKVLGFYDKEVYDYVTREIVLLTIIGILFGLVFGYFLNMFILSTCEIGILRFKRIVTPLSMIISSLITIVFTMIVNFITYFSLKKINMIESLKSVE